MLGIASGPLCLSFPSICVVLPGSLFENEVDEQVQAGIEGAIDESDLCKIIKLHDKSSRWIFIKSNITFKVLFSELIFVHDS